jgi:hypothetical protein
MVIVDPGAIWRVDLCSAGTPLMGKTVIVISTNMP